MAIERVTTSDKRTIEVDEQPHGVCLAGAGMNNEQLMKLAIASGAEIEESSNTIKLMDYELERFAKAIENITLNNAALASGPLCEAEIRKMMNM